MSSFDLSTLSSSTNKLTQQFQEQRSIPNNGDAASATYNILKEASSTGSIFTQEKVYKKKSQIHDEFDFNYKDLRKNLNDVLECLEQRSATQISIIYELQDFFKKRAEIEAQYSKDLDKLVENIYEKHKFEKKRKMWNLFSPINLWDSLLNDTKQHSKVHQDLSDICSKYIGDKFDEIIEDVKRIFTKCKSVGKESHEEIFKVIGELHGAMKTYHEHQSESKQAEEKLKDVISKKPKTEKQGNEKKMKEYEKELEKSQQNSMDKKIESFKARNKYILSIDSVNAGINKYYKEDIDDLIDCIDFRFIHGSIAKCINMYISGQEDIKRSRQITMYVLNRAIGDLDSDADKKAYLASNANVFSIKNIFQYEPYKGDEVSQLNAQMLIREDMRNKFDQLESLLKNHKTENDEIYKTIQATEQLLLEQYDLKKFDVFDLFSSNTNQNGLIERRLETEDYYIKKFEQYTIKSNLIARLEAQHGMMKKALSSPIDRSLDAQQLQLLQEKPKKKIGKLPPIEQPTRLFGGDLIQYLNATKQEIPLIITSCIKAIKRLGLHKEGIFRVTGLKEKIDQFKAAFESGEDPLIKVNNPKEMYNVADVLKSYFRELRNPLFTDDNFEALDNIMTAKSECEPVEQQEKQKIESLKEFIEKLPDQIYVVMRYLFAFLNHLFEFRQKNLMDSNAIAVCMAPALIPVKYKKPIVMNKVDDYKKESIGLIKLMIENHYDIFCKKSIKGPIYEKCGINDNEENESEEEGKSDQHMIRSISTAVMLNQQQSTSSLGYNCAVAELNSASISFQSSSNHKSSAQTNLDKPSTINNVIKKFNKNENETTIILPNKLPQQQIAATATTSGDEKDVGSSQKLGRKETPQVLRKFENKEILSRLVEIHKDNGGNRATNSSSKAKISKIKTTDV